MLAHAHFEVDHKLVATLILGGETGECLLHLHHPFRVVFPGLIHRFTTDNFHPFPDQAEL